MSTDIIMDKRINKLYKQYCTIFINYLTLFICRKCDLAQCQKTDMVFLVLHGCGHSFHASCIAASGACSICTVVLEVAVKTLVIKANQAIFNPTVKENLKQHEESEIAEESVNDNLNSDVTSDDSNLESIISDINGKILKLCDPVAENEE